MTDQGQPAAARPAGWHRDPFGRFYGRYWDGERWTDQVVKENRSQATDPPGPSPAASAGAPARGVSPPSAPTVTVATEQGGRSWRTWQLLAAVAVAFLIGAVAGAGTAEKDETVAAAGQSDTTQASDTTRATLSHVQVIPPSSTPAPTPPPTVATTTTAPGPKTTFGEGSYRVGIDIAPGTYRSSGTSTACYWKRMSNFTGTDDIIANYLSVSPTTVTILASDKGFETRRCGTWTAV